MIKLGLMGWPVNHSLSPKLHCAAFRELGMDGEYSLYPLLPGDISGMGDLINQIRTGEMTGLNVTIPHKQAVMPLLDRVTAPAAAIGAVNTIFLEQGKVVGHNTDAPGFLADLRRFMMTEMENNGRKVLVLGAGGSARAVVWALAGISCRVLVASRNIDQALILVNSIQKSKGNTMLEAVELNPGALSSHLPGTELIVNTTPVGMSPGVEFSPWPAGLGLPESASVYDLIYNPLETMLVKHARAAGLRATTGLGMLVEQAALGFEIWTGRKPPRVAMLSGLEE
jgi:shikimate dehydrogenase